MATTGTGIITSTDNIVELASIMPQLLVDEILEQTKNCALVWNAVSLTQFQTSLVIGNGGYQIYLSKIRNGDGTIDYNLDVLTDTFQRKYFTNSDSQPDLIDLYRIIDRTLNVDTPGNRMKEFLQSFGTPNCVPVNVQRHDTIPIADTGVLGKGGAFLGQSYVVAPSGGIFGFGDSILTHATIDIGSGGIATGGDAILSSDSPLTGGSATVTSMWAISPVGGSIGIGNGVMNTPMGGVGGGVAQVTLLDGPLSFFKPRSDGFASANVYLFSNRTGRVVSSGQYSQTQDIAPYYFLPDFPPQAALVVSFPSGEFALDQFTGDLFVVDETWAIPANLQQNNNGTIYAYSHTITLYQVQRQGFDISSQHVITVNGSTNLPTQIPMAISIDDINKVVYMFQAWSNNSCQLLSCNYDGSNFRTIEEIPIHTFAITPWVLHPGAYLTGFEVDATRQCCYWLENVILTNSNYAGSTDTTNTSEFFVGRINLADGTYSYIYSDTTGGGTSLTLDQNNQKLYISYSANQFSTTPQTSTGTVVVDLTGGSSFLNVNSTAMSVDQIDSDAFAIVNTPSSTGQIQEIPIIGGIVDLSQRKEIVNLPECFGPLKHGYPPISESYLQPTQQFYFLATTDTIETYQGATNLYVLNADNSATSLLDLHPANLPDNPGTVRDVRTIATYQNKIYFVSHGMVYSINSDGTHLTHLTTLGSWTDPSHSIGTFASTWFPNAGPAITIDKANKKLYIAGNSLWSCNLDGTQTQQFSNAIFSAPVSRLVVDPIGGNIFWLQSDGQIYWSAINNIQPTQSLSNIIDSGAGFGGFYLDNSTQRLHWLQHTNTDSLVYSGVINVNISAPASLNAFSAQRLLTVQPIDPNFNYGHYLYAQTTSCAGTDLSLDIQNNRAYFIQGGATFVQTDLNGQNLLVYYIQDSVTNNLLQITAMAS